MDDIPNWVINSNRFEKWMKSHLEDMSYFHLKHKYIHIDRSKQPDHVLEKVDRMWQKEVERRAKEWSEKDLKWNYGQLDKNDRPQHFVELFEEPMEKELERRGKNPKVVKKIYG